jgi:hypothetical protein
MLLRHLRRGRRREVLLRRWRRGWRSEVLLRRWRRGWRSDVLLRRRRGRRSREAGCLLNRFRTALESRPSLLDGAVFELRPVLHLRPILHLRLGVVIHRRPRWINTPRLSCKLRPVGELTRRTVGHVVTLRGVRITTLTLLRGAIEMWCL